MRRWRGNHRFPWTVASSRQGARPQPAAFRGCSVRAGPHLLCSPRRHARQSFGRDRMPPSRPRSHRLTLTLPLQALGLHSPRALGRAWPPSSPSSPPMRCPGSGLQRSVGSRPRSPCVRLVIARDHGISASDRRWRSCLRRHGNPAGESSAETWPSLPVQRHSRGANRIGEEGRVDGELSGSPDQGLCDLG